MSNLQVQPTVLNYIECQYLFGKILRSRLLTFSLRGNRSTARCHYPSYDQSVDAIWRPREVAPSFQGRLSPKPMVHIAFSPYFSKF